MKKHFMIDLETMGVNPEAPIISAGVVEFDPNGDPCINTLEVKFDFEEAFNLRKTDPSTIKWWMGQSDEARKELISGDDLVGVGLEKIRKFLLHGEHTTAFENEAIVWGNGATFDITMLESLFRAYHVPVPWAFWNVRDVRTVVDMASGIVDRPPMEKGVAHKSLDDAKHQAKYVTEMWKTLTSGFD